MALVRKDAPGVGRPWYWLAVLALAAVAATALVVLSARAQLEDSERGFEAAQQLRLQRVEQRVDDYFAQSIELASFGAHTLGKARGNAALSRELTGAILLSRHRRDVYGVGVFYQPYAFDAHDRLVSIYDHVGESGFSEVGRGGFSEIVLVSDAVGGATDYTRFGWYRRAVAAHGSAAFFGPYSQSRSFISTVQAFYGGHHLIGVVSVDTLTTSFKHLMAGAVGPNDVAWIESSLGGGRKLVATGPIPTGARVDRRTSMRYTGAFVHLSTNGAVLTAARRNVITMSIALIAAIWGLAVLIGIGLVQRSRAQELRRELLEERRRLEGQIAVSRTVEAELRKAAFTDTLTGLPNRAAFMEHAQAILAGDNTQPKHAVFFIDLDRFNIVNETLGHLAGDDLLRAIAARLRAISSEDDLIARLGGDEFVIIAAVRAPLEELAAKMLAYLGKPIVILGRTIYCEASIGIVAWDGEYRAPEELLRDADIAMYEAKRRGRSQAVTFDAAMRSRVAAESLLENDLRRAIDRGELLPYFQPIVSVEARTIVGFEALVRWNRPDGTIAPAHEFVHFAEQRGFVTAIDVLVFRDAFARAKTIFSLFPDATLAVNVSAAELSSPGFCEMVEEMIERHGLAGERIKFEITETAMMTSSEGARHTIERLRALGIEFALDDFGTGYSSLSYLQRLPIAELKIDRSFVAPLLTDPKALEIVRSIVLLAKSFGLSTTAEGVESLEQFELLASLGIDRAQGFFFSPAVDVATLVRFQNRAISSRAAVE